VTLIPPLVSDLPDLLILLSPLEPEQLIVFGFLGSIEGLSVTEILRLLVVFFFFEEETCDFLVSRNVCGGCCGGLREKEQETEH